jgi:hypothetical protein
MTITSEANPLVSSTYSGFKLPKFMITELHLL